MAAHGDDWVVYPLQIIVKSTYMSSKGVTVTRRMRLVNPTYERMREVVEAARGAAAGVEYRDPQGDVVSVTSWLEWQECVRVFIACGETVKLNLVRRKPAKGAVVPVGRAYTCVPMEDRWQEMRAVLCAMFGDAVFDTAMQQGRIDGAPSWVHVHPQQEVLLLSRRRLTAMLPQAPIDAGSPLAAAQPARLLQALAAPPSAPEPSPSTAAGLPWCVPSGVARPPRAAVDGMVVIDIETGDADLDLPPSPPSPWRQPAAVPTTMGVSWKSRLPPPPPPLQSPAIHLPASGVVPVWGEPSDVWGPEGGALSLTTEAWMTDVVVPDLRIADAATQGFAVSVAESGTSTAAPSLVEQVAQTLHGHADYAAVAWTTDAAVGTSPRAATVDVGSGAYAVDCASGGAHPRAESPLRSPIAGSYGAWPPASPPRGLVSASCGAATVDCAIGAATVCEGSQTNLTHRPQRTWRVTTSMNTSPRALTVDAFAQAANAVDVVDRGTAAADPLQAGAGEQGWVCFTEPLPVWSPLRQVAVEWGAAEKADAAPRLALTPGAHLNWTAPTATVAFPSTPPRTPSEGALQSLGWMRDGTPDVVPSSSFSTFASTPGPASLPGSAAATPAGRGLVLCDRQPRGGGYGGVASLTTDLFATAVDALFDAARALQGAGMDSDSDSATSDEDTCVASAAVVRSPSTACGLRKRPRSASMTAPHTARASMEVRAAAPPRPVLWAEAGGDKRVRLSSPCPAPAPAPVCFSPSMLVRTWAGDDEDDDDDELRTPSEMSLPASDTEDDVADTAPPPPPRPAAAPPAPKKPSVSQGFAPVAPLDARLFVDRPLPAPRTPICAPMPHLCFDAVRNALAQVQHLFCLTPGSPPTSPQAPPPRAGLAAPPAVQEMPKLITWKEGPDLAAALRATLTQFDPIVPATLPPLAPGAAAWAPITVSRRALALLGDEVWARPLPPLPRPKKPLAMSAPRARHHSPTLPQARAPRQEALSRAYAACAPAMCPGFNKPRRVARREASSKAYEARPPAVCPGFNYPRRDPPLWTARREAGSRAYEALAVAACAGWQPQPRRSAAAAAAAPAPRCICQTINDPPRTPWLDALCQMVLEAQAVKVVPAPPAPLKAHECLKQIVVIHQERKHPPITPWLDTLCELFVAGRCVKPAAPQKLITAGPKVGPAELRQLAAGQCVTATRYAVHRVEALSARLLDEHLLAVAQCVTTARYTLHRLERAAPTPLAAARAALRAAASEEAACTAAQRVTAARYALHARDEAGESETDSISGGTDMGLLGVAAPSSDGEEGLAEADEFVGTDEAFPYRALGTGEPRGGFDSPGMMDDDVAMLDQFVDEFDDDFDEVFDAAFLHEAAGTSHPPAPPAAQDADDDDGEFEDVGAVSSSSASDDFELIDSPDAGAGGYAAEVEYLRDVGVTAPLGDVLATLAANDGDVEETLYALRPTGQ
eukprot:TRINITY_DN5045_c0_g3_i2.p2 TRINITY_DN5045_c0_g3~~TRINITY_DN5045_c0_g3_i2.p2  ORF type:complete len:1483 (+),score=475.38 TRINITY_DN5045_c0_g3_i2:100-4449(+)